MNFYKRFIGDITAKTGGLSMSRMGAYDRLLDHYFSTEQPIAPEEVYSICRAMNKAERDDVDHVLKRFWDLTPEGYVQAKADEVIAKAKPLIEAARANGKKGGRPRKAENPEKTQRVSDGGDEQARKTDFAPLKNGGKTDISCDALNADFSNGDSREINNLDEKTKPAGFSQITQQKPSTKASQSQSQTHSPSLRSGEVGAEALGVPAQLLADWLVIRKAKKVGKLTETAADMLRREAKKVGLTPLEAIEACCLYGWGGFNAGWYAERQPAAPKGGSHSAEPAWRAEQRQRTQQAAPGVAAGAPASQFFVDVDARRVPDSILIGRDL